MEIKNGRAQINIGKNGITPTFLEHLKTILKKEKIEKIKILKEISMEQGNEPLINKIIEDLNVFVSEIPFSLINEKIKKERIYYNSLTADLRYFKNPKNVLASIFNNKFKDKNTSTFNFYKKLQ